MSFDLRFESFSEEETQTIGRHLATVLPGRAVVLLSGELGTGKTTLTKGIAEGRGAASASDVTSPTFALIHEYGAPPSVYHVDLYRLDTAEQARRLGLEELFERDALVLIEWGERFPELMPLRRFELQLTHAGDDRRVITVEQFDEPVSAR